MYKRFALLPAALLVLTGCCCDPATRLRHLVEDSTTAIFYNADAVEYSTGMVCENIRVTEDSTVTIRENHRLLEKTRD